MVFSPADYSNKSVAATMFVFMISVHRYFDASMSVYSLARKSGTCEATQGLMRYGPQCPPYHRHRYFPLACGDGSVKSSLRMAALASYPGNVAPE